MKKKLWFLAVVLISMTSLTARAAIETTRVIQEKDTIWGFGVEGINLYSRQMHRIDIAYDTKDPEGNACRMSGVIIIPKDVYDGEQKCDGTILMHHYTQLAKKDAPSHGYNTGEDMALANPLSPNYIMVLPDFYGFGITEDKDQWYCYGTANAHAALDCLLAALDLLEDRAIDRGKFMINAGYSSGGYDAIATQKVRDMEYKDKISFDRTVVGGLPFDLQDAYSEYVNNKDYPWRLFGLLMIMDSYNHHANLGFTPEQMLKPPFDEKLEEWIHSGKYTTADIMVELQGKKLEDVLQEPFMKRSTPEYKAMNKALAKCALANDWEPDPTQKYSVFHIYKDVVVPVAADRALLNFLANYEYEDGRTNPFKKTIIPELSHLSTNFFLPLKDHSLVSGIMYYIGLAATLTALPVLYYDDELNTHYADFVQGLTPLELVKTLDKKYNLKAMVKEKMESGDGSSDIFSILAKITQTANGYLEPYDMEFGDMLLIADDCGLSMEEILNIYTYLTTPDEPESSSNRAGKTTDGEPQLTPFLADYYFNYLNNWYNNAK
jgi:hypothetical protein